jgi:hypothetical protein
MSKVIIIQDCDLESYYQQTMNYLHAKYHNQYPTLRDSRSGQGECGHKGFSDPHGGDLSGQARLGDGSDCLGKTVF